MGRTTVGYAGGKASDPTYRDIGDHTEAIQIEYEPDIISFCELLDVFWTSHDATREASRQYRSAIFVSGEGQRQEAQSSLDEALHEYGRISTQIEEAGTFTRAEDYHQKYRLRADKTLLAEFAEMYPDEGELADSTAAARVNGFLDGRGTPTGLERVIDDLGLSEPGKDRLRKIVERNQPGLFRRLI